MEITCDDILSGAISLGIVCSPIKNRATWVARACVVLGGGEDIPNSLWGLATDVVLMNICTNFIGNLAKGNNPQLFSSLLQITVLTGLHLIAEEAKTKIGKPATIIGGIALFALGMSCFK